MSDTLSHPEFKTLRQKYIDSGLPVKDLLPIAPIGCKILESSALSDKTVGKVPSRFLPHKQVWCGLTGEWATKGLTEKQIEENETYLTSNIGLRAGDFPAIDIDVNSYHMRVLVENIATEVLGEAPVRARENSPRVLLMYKTQAPFPKTRLVFKCVQEIEHVVEVLGLGQQYILEGQHKEGGRYYWRIGASIENFNASGLSEISLGNVGKFIEKLKQAIHDNGGVVISHSDSRPQANTNSQVSKMKAQLPVEEALAALNAIPNTGEVLPTRESLIGVLASFKSALGAKALDTEVRNSVAQWAIKENWCEEEYFEKIWDSLDSTRTGSGHFLQLAKAHGYQGLTAVEFMGDIPAPTIATPVTSYDEYLALVQDTKIDEVASRLVYCVKGQTWFLRETGDFYTAAEVNNHYKLGLKLAPAGSTGKKTGTSILLNSGAVDMVDSATYMPQQPQIFRSSFEGANRLYFNTWGDGEDKGDFKDVTSNDIDIWLKHTEYLFRNPVERNFLLDYLACLVQRRGTKIRFAVVILGAKQGTGKDLFFRPIAQGLGTRNCEEIAPERFLDTNTLYYQNELVIVQEMMRSEKNNTYEKLKAVITGTGAGTIGIRKMYNDTYYIPNTVNFVFFTNHTDAIALAKDDRRYFVIETNARPKDAAYYNALADDFLRDKEGWKMVWHWLAKRDISKFNPNAAPLLTEAKTDMMKESQPHYITSLSKQFEEDGLWGERTVMTCAEVLDAVDSEFSIFTVKTRETVRSSTQVARILAALGWSVREERLNIKGVRTRLWVKYEALCTEGNDAILALYNKELTSPST